MDHEALFKQRKTLVIIQILGMAFGLYLAFADIKYYESFVDVLSSFLTLPFFFAGILRLGVRGFQIARLKFGRKVYDEVTGSYFIIARPGLGVAVGLALPIILVGFVAMLRDISMFLLAAVFILLLVVELIFFIKDIKFLKVGKTTPDGKRKQ